MSSKHIQNAPEATSSKDRTMQQSSNSTSAKIERIKASGAFHGTVASTTAPPPDPPPIKTINVLSQTFDKGHYDPTKGRIPRFCYNIVDGAVDFMSRPRIAAALAIVSGFLATLFSISARTAFCMKDLNSKFGILSGLTPASAGNPSLSRKARKRDCSVANASSAAILIVFLGGNFATALETSTNTGLGPSSLLTSTQTTLETSTVTTLSTVIETVSAQSLQTTPTESRVASQTSSMPLSTGSASNTSGGLSQTQKIGLGVGLGVGIPAVLAGLLLFLNRWRLRRKAPLVIEPIHQGLY